MKDGGHSTYGTDDSRSCIVVVILFISTVLAAFDRTSPSPSSLLLGKRPTFLPVALDSSSSSLRVEANHSLLAPVFRRLSCLVEACHSNLDRHRTCTHLARQEHDVFFGRPRKKMTQPRQTRGPGELGPATRFNALLFMWKRRALGHLRSHRILYPSHATLAPAM